MTPSEHYQEAERLLREAEALTREPQPDALDWATIYTRRAQVHATLANNPLQDRPGWM